MYVLDDYAVLIFYSIAFKNHRNGIKKPKKYRYPSLKGVSVFKKPKKYRYPSLKGVSVFHISNLMPIYRSSCEKGSADNAACLFVR